MHFWGIENRLMQRLYSFHVMEEVDRGKISFIKRNVADSLEAKTDNYIAFGFFSFAFYHMPVIAKSWKAVTKVNGWKHVYATCKLPLMRFLEQQLVGLFKYSWGVSLDYQASLTCENAQLHIGHFSVRIGDLQLWQLGKYWRWNGDGLPDPIQTFQKNEQRNRWVTNYPRPLNGLETEYFLALLHIKTRTVFIGVQLSSKGWFHALSRNSTSVNLYLRVHKYRTEVVQFFFYTKLIFKSVHRQESDGRACEN